MFSWLKDVFRFDGIQDHELSEGSDAIWLTPMERIAVQSRDDAEIAKKLIEERKVDEQDRVPDC